MYFYTGPGGNESPPPLDSDEEDLPLKKADSEPARKSSRANKGRNTRLERGDEVVDIPQVKEAPKPNLNPSWLKNHDSKSQFLFLDSNSMFLNLNETVNRVFDFVGAQPF